MHIRYFSVGNKTDKFLSHKGHEGYKVPFFTCLVWVLFLALKL